MSTPSAPPQTARTGLRRRDLLAAALLAASAGRGRAAAAPRVVALDWGWAETLVALGRPPVGIVEKAGYRNLVVAPALPDAVQDVGVHTEPNLERIHRLAPDLIVSTPALESVRHRVAPIAPVLSLGIYPAPDGAFRRAQMQTHALAAAIGAEAEARALLARAAAALQRWRAGLCAWNAPVYVVRIVDARHGVVFGRTSLLQGILDELGLVNAWDAPTNAYGTLSIGLEKLAARSDAWLVAISTGGAGAVSGPSGPLWQALPFVRERRVVALPSIWGYGAVPAAMRFADLLGSALTARCNG